MKTSLPILALVAACSSSERLPPSTGGTPAEGKATIKRYGCDACHDIPGFRGFGGGVGPPLAHIGSRPFIAGEVPNTPINLTRWIRDPHAIETHTAMPTLGLTDKEARDVAAYLYTLD